MTSKRTRAILITLFLLGLLIGLPAWLIYGEIRQQRLDHALIAAIKVNNTSAALALLKKGASPNSLDMPPISTRLLLFKLLNRLRGAKNPTIKREGPTALMLAVKRDNSDVVHALLSRGARGVNAKVTFVTDPYSDPKQLPLLLFAIEKANVSIVRDLLRSGADVNGTDENGQTALILAASVPDVSDYDHDEKRAISKWRAVSARYETIVTMLLASGANVHAKDQDGDTALYFAAACDQRKMVEMLLARGADPNIVVAYDDAPLNYAASNGDINMIKDLLHQGAYLNPTGETSNAPLTCSTNVSVLRFLLDGGADINGRCHLGKHHGATSLILWAYDFPIVRLLVSRGADVNAKDDSGSTPLMVAAQYGDVPTVTYLLDHGAKVNTRAAYDGTTALMRAAEDGLDDNMTVLLDRGARVNVADSDGATALMIAATDGNDAAAEDLLDAGARVNARDKSGQTALDNALDRDNTAVIALLKRAGARK